MGVRSKARLGEDKPFQREVPVILNDRCRVRVVCDLGIWTSIRPVDQNKRCEVEESDGEKKFSNVRRP